MNPTSPVASTRTWGIALAVLSCLSGALAAADVDPIAAGDDPEASTFAWSWFGDAELKGDDVRGLPGREALERGRLRVRFGARGQVDDWDFGASFALRRGSEPARDIRRNLDNEEADAFGLDRAYVRWQATPDLSVLVGKTPMPLSLTPLLWDDDLRPVGASIAQEWQMGEGQRLAARAGYFAGEHLYDDDSRIAAAQLGWTVGEGGDMSGELLLAFLHFDDLERLTSQGLARTNRRVGTSLVSDYRVGDFQAAVRYARATLPIELRVDLARNFGADDQRDAARLSATLGSSRDAGGWELGASAQRIQRDAVMAAFSADEWWFHSFARGYSAWLGYGATEHLSATLSGFVERRDDQASSVHRLTLDLRARW